MERKASAVLFHIPTRVLYHIMTSSSLGGYVKVTELYFNVDVP
jgi:hypothetical protein